MGHATSDSFSESGANRIMRRVQNYWETIGYSAIEVWTEPLATKYQDETSGRSGTIKGYVVRSNMIAGRPPKKAMAKAA